MRFSVNIKANTRVLINGKEYGSVDEMPADVRQTYGRAVAALKGQQGSVGTRSTSRIIFNNRTYDSVEDMPPDVRQAYEDLMAMAGSRRSGNAGLLEIGGPETGQQAGVSGHGPPMAQPAKSLKRIYRAIWFYVVTGFVLLLLAVAFGGRLEGKGQDTLSMRSPDAWILTVPVAFFLYAVYTSVRYWRCPYCGVSLPTNSSGWRQKNTCPRCCKSLHL